MEKDRKNFSGFFMLKKDEGNPSPSFAFGKEDFIEKTKNQWNEKSQSDLEKPLKIDDETNVQTDDPDFAHQSALTDALKASVEFGLAQHELVEASFIAPMMLRITMAHSQLIMPVVKDAEKLEDGNDWEVYGLTEQQYTKLVENHQKFESALKGFERFPSATLLSLVATFDTLVVDVLAKMLQLQSDWLERSQRTVAISRLANASSLEEIIKEEISEEVYLFSRCSHTEQADYIKRNFGIDIKQNWKRWPDYIEIFERRNLVAHGERSFNARYVAICSREGHKGSHKIFGNEVSLTSRYIKQSLDVLTEFLVLLSFSLFRKFVKEKEADAFSNLNEAVYKLNKGGRYLVAERVSEYALSLRNTKIQEQTRLMLIVNRASSVRHQGRDEEAKKIIEEEDWSASSDLFKFCVASVLGDVDEFVRLLKPLKDANQITAQSLLTWPCFKFMLEDEASKAALDAEFNLAPRRVLVENADENAAIEADADGVMGSSDDTIH